MHEIKINLMDIENINKSIELTRTLINYKKVKANHDNDLSIKMLCPVLRYDYGK